MSMNEKLISETIRNIRFPMMMGVVMIHAKISTDSSVSFANTQEVLSNLIPSPCVPIFFLMSSFLFFFNVNELTGIVYVEKMKRRTKTLLIPYLIWNSITICVFACMHLFLPNLINPEFQNVPSWDWTNYLNAFWKGSGGFPISYQLWFLRDLIVLMVFTPLFYLCINKIGNFRWLVLLVVGYLYYLDNHGIAFGVFYFYVGSLIAYLVRNKKIPNLSSTAHYILGGVISVFASMIILAVILETLPQWHNPIMRVSGTISYILICIMLTKNSILIPKCLRDCSFFVYLFHSLPLMVTGRVLVNILKPNTTILLIAAYILNVVIIIGSGVLIYYFLRKFFPRITFIMCGGR